MCSQRRGLKLGQGVMVEAFGDDEDAMWLSKAVAVGDIGPLSSSWCKQNTGQQKGSGTSALLKAATSSGVSSFAANE